MVNSSRKSQVARKSISKVETIKAAERNSKRIDRMSKLLAKGDLSKTLGDLGGEDDGQEERKAAGPYKRASLLYSYQGLSK